MTSKLIVMHKMVQCTFNLICVANLGCFRLLLKQITRSSSSCVDSRCGSREDLVTCQALNTLLHDRYKFSWELLWPAAVRLLRNWVAESLIRTTTAVLTVRMILHFMGTKYGLRRAELRPSNTPLRSSKSLVCWPPADRCLAEKWSHTLYPKTSQRGSFNSQTHEIMFKPGSKWLPKICN